ncbi:superoxide dismutase family protein [Bacillus carboniphilus]|uniref:Superoxide dismutase [Cu-Zn] n=1 Tax=Bacillus carboniphilus TaxID=86663 RepID=A0ABY9JVD1_9BACI|nr:superoxide dismutase family protein [Bacillus carboniphilus]WLR43347.1 superoxide dismutase family protein [Bacillus carboniphilus]
MKRPLVALLICSFVIVGCQQEQLSEESIPVGEALNDNLSIPLINQAEEKIGVASLNQVKDKLYVRIISNGLTAGEHGVHFHETGLCEAPSFISAGGHFNPEEASHGFHNGKDVHAGDLPNIFVQQDGTVDMTVSTTGVTLMAKHDHSLLDRDGSSIIIHENSDDYKTDPSGNSGDRFACGVISGQ